MKIYIFVSLIFSFIAMPFYVEYKILTNMPLLNGSEIFESWKEPPVKPRMIIYVFNLTNHDAFMSGKPNLILDS